MTGQQHRLDMGDQAVGDALLQVRMKDDVCLAFLPGSQNLLPRGVIHQYPAAFFLREARSFDLLEIHQRKRQPIRQRRPQFLKQIKRE